MSPTRIFSQELNDAEAGTSFIDAPREPGSTNVQLGAFPRSKEKRNLTVSIDEQGIAIVPSDAEPLNVSIYEPGSQTVRTKLFNQSLGRITLRRCPSPDEHVLELRTPEDVLVNDPSAFRDFIGLIALAVQKQQDTQA
jgi:hypothetical protein